jgi:hypothetical protein
VQVVAGSADTLLVLGTCTGDISIGRDLDHLETASPANDSLADAYLARVAP